MAEEETGQTSDVIIPASLTDVVKALREFIGLGRDVVGVWTDIAVALERRKAKDAARHLDALVFMPQGSRRHLERLANGTGTADDVQAIGDIMHRTATSVEQSIDNLGQYRDALREKVGMGAASLLDNIIYGPVRKRRLRHVLHELADNGATDDGIRLRVPELAGLALEHIEKLNAQLVELHDMILQVGKK